MKFGRMKSSVLLMGKKVVITAVAGALLLQPMFIASESHAEGTTSSAAVSGPVINLVSEEPVTSGATLKRYVWKSTRQNQEVSTHANVVEIDLNHPYVKLDVVTGVGNQYTKKQTVLKMAQETGAVAAVNGDYYSTQAEGAPIGPQIANSELMSSPAYLSGLYTFALTKDNRPIIDRFTFEGSIINKDGFSYPLAGINKTYYWTEPNGKHSHADAMYIYTNAWGQAERANDGATTPTEVLVQNGMITQISDKAAIPVIPPKDGYILRAAGKAGEFVRTNMKVGDKLFTEYTLVPLDPQKQYDTSSFKMMIGGHTIMVDEGKPAAYSRNVSSLGGNRSRTGVGYSKDGRYVYLITVDNSGDSQGMSMKEFQQFMVSVGVWKGLNLDGGGSTQMAARPLGDFDVKLANQTEYGTERKVVNGLGVFSTAPKGETKGIILQGNSILFINEKAQFSLKGYDEYYNPMQIDTVLWSSSNPIGAFEGNIFSPKQSGMTTLTASHGQVKQSKEVEVIGKNQIAGMRINEQDYVLSEGGTYKLPVVVTTKSGKQRTVPAESIQWEFVGLDGTMSGDTLTVNRLSNNGIGQLIARYDQFSTMLALPAGVDKMWADFDKLTYPITFEGHPAETTGQARVVTGITGMDGSDSQLLYLTYDFSKGTGTKAAYAVFGASGAKVEGKPNQMKLNVMGDNSLNWLRAEVVDAKGKLHRIDLHKNINWYGWKELNVNLAEYPISYPMVLKRIYAANQEQGQDEREARGAIVIDDIRFQYKGQMPDFPKALVKMAVNRKSITVNNQAMQLDQAPLVIRGNTLIPIKFFVDAMGGKLKWDNKEKKLTILRGEHLIELWIDNPEMIVDGQAATAPMAPMVMNGRTVLPLRLISEKLGWKVGWDQATKSIILE